MSKNNNIIKINGKLYDAKTGANLSHPGAGHAKSSSKHHQPSAQHATKPDVSRPPGHVHRGHKPKPSKTLMRHVVKKPGSFTKDKRIKAQGPSDISLAPLADVVVSKSAKKIDHMKLTHARRVPKSHLISHFSEVTSDVNAQQTDKNLIASKPNEHPTSHVQVTSKKAKPKTTAELLEHAVSQANSHEEPAPKLKSHQRRKTRAAVASIVAVMLLAFVGYQELPNIRLNIASAKAGFSATLPGYKPAGYSMSKLSYSTGIVATKFTSNSDDRKYTLTQKTSNWDSQALKENFLLKNSERYTVSESGGQKIFLYGNGNATWVNGGVWYVIQSSGSLTDHQLVELAKSV